MNAAHDKKTTEPVILVVDDVQANILIVSGILSEAGYKVVAATSGAQALEWIKSQSPDLILLDSIMPDVNGVEICRQIKEYPLTQKIPVIFLTASNEMDDLVQAFAAGAVDFVTKPFRAEELLARVRTHLELKIAREALWNYGQRLRELNDEKNTFLGIVAHDLRSPLSNIVTSATLALEDKEMPREQLDEFLDIINASAQHMIHLVENLMDVNAIEQGKMKMNIAPCELTQLARSVTANYAAKARAKGQALEMSATEEPLVALADEHSTIQVFDNLISNAIKYSPSGRRIDVRLLRRKDVIRCEVHDQGPGLSQDDLKKMFGKFARLSARPTAGEPSTGLGLSIVKRMVEAVGGKVWCESEPGKGSRFIVEFPAAES